MRIFIVDSRLTEIRTIAAADEVLQEVRNQNYQLAIEVENDNYVYFHAPNENEITVYEPDRHSSIPMEFQPSLRLTNQEAAKRLWQLRKYYNKHWRD